jgi:hypothetical protein
MSEVIRLYGPILLIGVQVPAVSYAQTGRLDHVPATLHLAGPTTAVFLGAVHAHPHESRTGRVLVHAVAFELAATGAGHTHRGRSLTVNGAGGAATCV